MPSRPEANLGFLWWSAGGASNCFAGPVRFDDSPQPAPRRHVDGAGGAGQAGGARDTTPLSRSGGRRRRPVNTASRAPQGSSRRWARSQLVQSAARPARQGSRSTERLELQGRQMEGRPSAAAMTRRMRHLGRHVGGRHPGRGAVWSKAEPRSTSLSHVYQIFWSFGRMNAAGGTGSNSQPSRHVCRS